MQIGHRGSGCTRCRMMGGQQLSANPPKIEADPAIGAGMLNLFRLPIVHYGCHAEEAISRLASERGARRVLPVVTSSLLANRTVQNTLARLGSSTCPVFSALKPHTPLEVVLDLVETIDRLNPDLIVVFGGGSAIDAAKIARLAIAAGQRDREGLLGLRGDQSGRRLPEPGSLPIIAVPTTLSAAEFGIIGGATDMTTGIKHIFRSETLAPDVVVYDPWLGAETPPDLWLSTGIRSVDHGIEAVLSRDATPLTDALALRGLKLLQEGLRGSHAQPNSIAARHHCQLGVWLAGSTIGRVPYGASHGLGHQLGAVAGVPHGITSCVLLPAVLTYNEPMSSERQAEIAAAFNRPGVKAADAVRDFIAGLGLPTRISQLDVPEEALSRIAETSLGNAFVQANIRPVKTQADALAILKLAYA